MNINDSFHLLDVVAPTDDAPSAGLQRGQVGTIIELLADDVFEVEFADNRGQTYALLPLRADQLLVLHDDPVI